MRNLGVYIHIPFCKQKCLYCDFVSFSGKEELQEKYMQAMKKEINTWKKQNESTSIETVYIGGGTPSYVNSKFIKETLELLELNSTAKEITIEINPGTVNKEKLEEYKNAGINRISIGLQSTNDQLLKQIGRIHDYSQFLNTYDIARKVGFNNLNIDLMIGLPNQKIADIKETLDEIIRLDPEHISVYSLIVEEGTPMEKLIEKGILKLPDEELERQMYWYVKNYLELNGYNHYEISNFSKEGLESKHNLDCWEQKEYIGFGISAHSYVDNTRFCNISDLNDYIKNCKQNEFDKNRIIQEIQDANEKMKEYMILGLRKIDGISIQKFKNIFNENPIMLFKNELNKLYEDGLILINGDIIKLSNRGLDLANLVWEEFI